MGTMPVNWVDNTGMVDNAAFLNLLGQSINSLMDFQSIATAATTTTLTVTSPMITRFTGITTQTCVLPDATTLTKSRQFLISNRSTGNVQLNANGGGAIYTLRPKSDILITLTDNSSAAGVWETVKGVKISGYSEAIKAIGTIGSTVTLDITDGTVLTATLTSATNCTVTMPPHAPSGEALSFIFLLKTPASGTVGTVTFTGVKWFAAGAPVITATTGKLDALSFISDGTNWYGSALQGATP